VSTLKIWSLADSSTICHDGINHLHHSNHFSNHSYNFEKVLRSYGFTVLGFFRIFRVIFLLRNSWNSSTVLWTGSTTFRSMGPQIALNQDRPCFDLRMRFNEAKTVHKISHMDSHDLAGPICHPPIATASVFQHIRCCQGGGQAHFAIGATACSHCSLQSQPIHTL
jgi:hypothetical protein